MTSAVVSSFAHDRTTRQCRGGAPASAARAGLGSASGDDEAEAQARRVKL